MYAWEMIHKTLEMIKEHIRETIEIEDWRKPLPCQRFIISSCSPDLLKDW